MNSYRVAGSIAAVIATMMMAASGHGSERLASVDIHDELTTALVRSKLNANQNTRNLRVYVQTSKGVVRLKGEVGSIEERELVGLLARNASDATAVKNDLIVRNEAGLAATGFR